MELLTLNLTIVLHILTNSKGCDSIVELNFNISTNSLTVFDTATACGSYNWKGITYTESGDYNYVSSNGCDGSVLSLTIKETIQQLISSNIASHFSGTTALPIQKVTILQLISTLPKMVATH